MPTFKVTLTYDGTPTGPDYLWVGATDPQGQQGTGSVVVNVGTSSASAPAIRRANSRRWGPISTSAGR